MIRDVKNFASLFKYNIPIHEEYVYYLSSLVSTGYDYNALYNAKIYADYEKDIENPHSHKMASMNKVIEYIKSTKTYNNFINNIRTESSNDYLNVSNEEYSNYKIDGVNKLNANYGDLSNVYLSLDLSKANYQVMKMFDNDDELCNNWVDLLKSLEINEIFHSSKTFRQHIFGNLNPNRNQRYQSIIMDKISKIISNIDAELIFKTADELIYRIPFSTVTFDISYIQGIKLTQKVYNIHKIDKNKYIKTDFSGFPIMKSFKGVEGNMFYLYLAKYFKDGIYDERDLMFIQDKKLAKWII